MASATAMAAALVLAGCGSDGGQAATPGQGATAPGFPLPGALAAGSPTVSPVPTPTGPVIHGAVNDKVRFAAQIVSVGTSTALPKVPTPAGKTMVLVRLRVTSDPVDHTMLAPPKEEWSITYPGCTSGSACVGADGESRFLPESAVRSGVTGGAAAVTLGETLAANTFYFTYIWKAVPVDADLSKAELCAARLPGPDECTPLGPVTPLTDVNSLDLKAF
ncbi:hypothetical protein ACIRBX_00065 [Kitasatospora sp. NPDC096147]|uniref:hypothetical protein n=1 Tax=Kitasatospora sp. NPDC096147 TaxID=3364093 RepID=UPI0038273399